MDFSPFSRAQHQEACLRAICVYLFRHRIVKPKILFCKFVHQLIVLVFASIFCWQYIGYFFQYFLMPDFENGIEVFRLLRRLKRTFSVFCTVRFQNHD